MGEEYSSVLSIPTEADTDISAKPKYQPRYISLSLIAKEVRFIYIYSE